jgi:hypothetical protein
MEPHRSAPFDLSAISSEVVEILLLDSSTESTLLDEIARENTHKPEILHIMLNHPHTPEHVREFVSGQLNLPLPSGEEISETAREENTSVRWGKAESLLQKVQHLKMGEKMQLAFKGSREIRAMLLRDANSEVMLAVMNNPKITEGEVELLAKQKSTAIEVLREISRKKEWIRSYSIIHSLVSNPKTPIGIALKHINTLRLKDLVMIEKNKNLPSAVRAGAKKLITARKS